MVLCCTMALRRSRTSCNRHSRWRITSFILVNCWFFVFFCRPIKVSSQTGIPPDSEPMPDPRRNRTTLQADIDTLFEIKEWLGNTSRVDSNLATWALESDPCRDNWAYIRCDCNELDNAYPDLIEACDNYTSSGEYQRVIFLGLRGGTGGDEQWSGTLTDAFGKLEKLRVLELSGNEFTGTIPRSFQNLTHIRRLDLAGNQLNGTIPEFFGSYTELKRLDLSGNNLTGPIPKALCDNIPENNVTIVLDGNQDLCGPLPECLVSRLKSLDDTYAYSHQINTSLAQRGDCDDTPPVCDLDEGCKIEVPKYWNSDKIVDFNFTRFTDNESCVESYDIFIVPNASADLPESTQSIRLSNVQNLTSCNTSESQINGNDSAAELISIHYDLAGDGRINDGVSYRVNITAKNNAGPPLQFSAASKPVLVDVSPPTFQGKIHNTMNGSSSEEQETGSLIGVSWGMSDFIDVHSNISHFEVFLQRVSPDSHEPEASDPCNITETLNNNSRLYFAHLNQAEEKLKIGQTYRFAVTAFDNANLNHTETSDDFKLVKKSSHWFRGTTLGLMTVMAILIFVLGCVTAGVILPIARSRRKHKIFNRDEHIKELMYKLLDTTEEDLRAASDPIMDQSEIAFVVTDLEASTQQSARNDAAFKQLMHTHNMIMRDTYDAYGGYEIQTEGDSFQLAFSSTASAVRFCLDAQRRFLDFKWSSEILHLPSCAVIKDVHGRMSFRGPRIRMAIHWSKDSVMNRVHSATRHLIFEGPAFDVTKELCNAASGGQLLISHDAWINFLPHFANTGFPTVEQLGCFKLHNWREEMYIYNVSQRVGEPIFRTFPFLQKVDYISDGSGLEIIPPPKPDLRGILTFVALRSEPRLNQMSTETVDVFVDLIAQYGQYFMGHLFLVDKEEGIIVFAFGSALNALRYCHILQVGLCLHHWQSDFLAKCPPSITGLPSSPIPLYHGPRVAAAVHSTKRFEIVYQLDSGERRRMQDSVFAGHGVTFVKHLVAVTHCGQTVLSGATWTPIQNTMPPESHCLSLGKHIIDEHYRNPVRLFELLPLDLENRDFPDLKTRELIEPGYRNAPSTGKDICIVFAKGHKPELVRKYEGRDIQGVSETRARDLIASYYESVSLYCSVVRKRLKQYNGYECKEPEIGKFTLAFHDVVSAIRWACHVQSELLSLDWPQELFTFEECQEKRHDERLIVIHRGLAVKIGIVYGKVLLKKPLITGRADYFGYIPNVAARVMSMARPGQILIHSSSEFDKNDVSWINDNLHNVGIIKYRQPLSVDQDGVDEKAIEISRLGMFLLRGVNELKLLYQAQPASVAYANRFGDMDPAKVYNGETHKKVSVSRLLNNIRIRKNFKASSQALSCFLSQTYQNKLPTALSRTTQHSTSFQGRLESSFPSVSTNASAAQETTFLLKPRSAIERTLPSPREEQPLSPIKDITDSVVLRVEDKEQVTPRSSDSESLELTDMEPPTIVARHDVTPTIQLSSFPLREDKQNEPNQDMLAVNSDDFVVSIGKSGCTPKVQPLTSSITHESSDEETTAPSEYGKKLANLYTNAGTAGTSSEFSFPRGVGDTSSSLSYQKENHQEKGSMQPHQ